MAENEIPQDNPSMEDILSSIKGILSEDEQGSPAALEQNDKKEDDEIFDLSSSMIIDTPSKPESHKPEDDITSVLDDDLPDIKLGEDEDIDISKEPVFAPQVKVEEEDISISAAPQNEPEPEAKEEAISEEQLDKLIQSIDDNNVDSVLEKEIPEEAPHAEEKELEKPEDVSDAIIDNFAQMFSENNKKAEPAAVAVAPAPAQIGNGAQTVEDLIKAVMAESLKPAIEQALASVDKDIMELAKEEVSKEAKIWVDKNLTEVVESVIREEVKRVMAKVGS